MIAQERASSVGAAISGWNERAGPLYLALAEALAEAIARRRIPGHLPSERALAQHLHISRGTVAAAYDVLRARGVIERQRGSGTAANPVAAHTVCPDPIACVREFFQEANMPGVSASGASGARAGTRPREPGLRRRELVRSELAHEREIDGVWVGRRRGR